MENWISQRQAAERYSVTSQTIRLWMLKYPDRVRMHKAGRFKFYHVRDMDMLASSVRT